MPLRRSIPPETAAVVSLLVAACLAGPAFGTPPAPGVEALVAEALERNPTVAALRARLAAAREMVAPRGALPDPMTELMYTEAAFPGYSVGEVEMSMIGVEVRQVLPWPGKREAARQVARAEADVEAAGLERLRRELAREVRVLYARIHAMDRELALIPAAREMLDLLATTTTARYSAGQASQEAVVKAQLTGVRLGEQEDDLRAGRRVMVAMLGRLLDRTEAFDVGPIEALPGVAPGPADEEAAALAVSPDVGARRAAVAAAERRLEAARLELRPNFSAGGSFASRGSLDPVVTLRFGVEWPLWRREKQAPLVRAAEHELELARREVGEAEAMVRESIRTLRARREQAEAQVRRYREGIVPLTQAALSAARTEYLNGQGDFAVVIDDFTMWLDARAQLARRESDLFIAWAALHAVAGAHEGEISR